VNLKNRMAVACFVAAVAMAAPVFAGEPYKEVKDEFTGSSAYVAKIRSARNSSSASFGGSSLGLVITKHVNCITQLSVKGMN
jgi:hypothetical protein